MSMILEILNLDGQEVYKHSCMTEPEAEENLRNLFCFPQGVYFVRIVKEHQIKTSRFTVNRP